MDFYADLFSAVQCSMERHEELLRLPEQSEKGKTDLDHELTLEEFAAAVEQLTSGRAPGIYYFD